MVGREAEDVELWDPVQSLHLQTLHSNVIDLESGRDREEQKQAFLSDLGAFA